MIATYSGSTVLNGLPPTFRQWQKRCYERGIPPVIAVAGSCGKSTVVRLLQAIFNHAGIQSAIWTDLGVEINGRRQRHEIAGWNRALARLTERSLDVAVQELDWNLVAAVGLPQTTYPIGILNNLCNNNAECSKTPLGLMAARALPDVASSIHPDGVLCVNGEDYALKQATTLSAARPVVIAKSDATPLLRQHRDAGDTTLWVNDNDSIVGGNFVAALEVAKIQHLPICQNGSASFQQTNVLLATAAALATGIGPDIIRDALGTFAPTVDQLPGSFSVRQVGTMKAIVDRIMPSWFLKSVLRAANPKSERRQITVIGGLASLPDHDVYVVGRMLGRAHGAVIHHGEVREEKYAELKRGLSRNAYPPVLVSLPTERRAINRALSAVRADDVLLFLTDDDPGPALRAVARM